MPGVIAGEYTIAAPQSVQALNLPGTPKNGNFSSKEGVLQFLKGAPHLISDIFTLQRQKSQDKKKFFDTSLLKKGNTIDPKPVKRSHYSQAKSDKVNCFVCASTILES